MIGAIVGLFNIVRGLFVGGGLVATTLTGLWGGITSILGLVGSLGTLLWGGISLIGSMWAYVASYHAIELIRRFLMITFIVSVFGWVINYAVTSVAVYSGKTISVLFNEFVTSILSFGALGHNLLAFLSKMGFFEALSLLLTVMIYTLISRVALSVLFK